MSSTRNAGLLLIIVMFILSFLPLNAEIQSIAIAEGASTLQTYLGILFPYFWIIITLITMGVFISDVVFTGK